MARTTASYRVLETSHPPTYYLPRAAFADGALRPVAGTTHCEWKGQATYYDLVTSARQRSGPHGPTPLPPRASRRSSTTSR